MTHFDIVHTHFGTVLTLFTSYDTVHIHFKTVDTHFAQFTHCSQAVIQFTHTLKQLIHTLNSSCIVHKL